MRELLYYLGCIRRRQEATDAMWGSVAPDGLTAGHRFSPADERDLDPLTAAAEQLVLARGGLTGPPP